MNVTLYHTGCPKCRILKSLLEKKHIEYNAITDIAIMTEKGFSTVPILEIDGEVIGFTDAMKWINERN